MKNSSHKSSILGIDIGSVSISIVQTNLNGDLLKSAYELHQGDPGKKLETCLQDFETDHVAGIATPGGKSLFNEHVNSFDPQVSLVRAIKKYLPDARSILHVGAEKFYLIALDQEGNYEYTTNSSSCAAGTGSFLDQQAKRLHLKNTGELVQLALQNKDKVPEIASRCAVFAKTDLIHAQQQGFSLGAICDSLCKGLAENIADTLFNKSDPLEPIVMTGGVAQNPAVVRHLEELLGIAITIHDLSHHMASLGASIQLMEHPEKLSNIQKVDPGILIINKNSREYHYDPLSGTRSVYPDFNEGTHYKYTSDKVGHVSDIQVDIYDEIEPGVESKSFKNRRISIYLGIDIGSTSTKALLVDENTKPLAGFYTYTSGQPLKAVQAIFEAIDDLSHKRKIEFEVTGCSTTGSGRKFVGNILKADRIYDEITAHARAAYELNPKTDTIIEIGGQDAKFTLMKDGIVTFSHMNTVCAAGTGSFIEELSGKLGVSLKDYSKRCENVEAPLASDRCTVFMERDINHLLGSGYKVDEVLATVLYSVRENYLKKVANEAQIGDHICFQGATAKNRSLVSAFEKRLGKPIYVSRYCHLTGALGCALLLKEDIKDPTQFRGLELYKKEIPISTETCDLCLNHCLISLASINGETEAYGFLCGRDYDTKKFVNASQSGFELLKARAGIRKIGQKKKPLHKTIIGIPATLHMLDDLDFWKDFFNELSFPIKTSERYKDSLRDGKRMAGAEFCAPVDAMYGHVAYLKEKVDYIFMPAYLESREKPAKSERNYCYYTQFSTSLAYLQGKGEHEAQFISPLLNFNRKKEQVIMQLHRTLNTILPGELSYELVNRAYNKAQTDSTTRSKALVSLFEKEFPNSEDISVVCLGRPYVVLSDVLNKGIPDIFSKQGIKAFYQDMVPLDDEIPEGVTELLSKVPWHFAAMILQVADKIAKTPMLYPVFITAYQCAPDSFIIEYFKQIMHLYKKPYLIVQIDEHDSNVGYETRIEAAIRSFRNHSAKGELHKPVSLNGLLPRVDYKLNDKTVLVPGWDTFISPLIVANLRYSGIDARLLESSDLSIRKSMAHNSGQCLPINIITQNYIEFIDKYKLDPEQTILWMTEAKLTCNIRQYPFYIKKLLNNYGNGMEKASVYSGHIAHTELSMQTTYHAYFAYMLGGLFRKVGCRIRPYETVKGTTNDILLKVQKELINLFENGLAVDNVLKICFKLFDSIEYNDRIRKPLIAIFGDLYVRDNDIMNQDLVSAIEEAGGEALTTPYHDYAKITFENLARRAIQRGEYLETSMNRVMLSVVKIMDERYYKPFAKYLGPPPVIQPKQLEKQLKAFNIDPYHSGESYDNILKIFYIVKNFPDISLFVQTNPAYCCPSLITEAMTHKIREITGVPVLTITYDGTSEQMNEAIVPYIQSAAGSRQSPASPTQSSSS